MIITDVKPFALWGGNRNFFFVKVETDDGRYGIGEGGLTWRELSCLEAVNHLKPLLVGEEASRTEHLWQVMFRGGFFPADKVVCSAIAAIDIALWDLRGKRLGVPVYELLGGRVRDRVACYPHANGATPEEIAERSRRLVAEGWKFIRFGLPSGGEVLEPAQAVRTAVEQFRAIRGAVGEDAEICLDVHTRLDPPDAIRLCRELEPYRPYFIEDPLRSENMHSFHQLARHVAVPLAAGEQFATKWDFRELIEEELIQYCRIDLCICGGITEARKGSRMVRDALHRAGAAQPARPRLRRRLPPPRPGEQQLRRSRVAAGAGQHPSGGLPGAGPVRARLPAPAHHSRPRRGVRRGGCLPAGVRLPCRAGAAPAKAGWELQQLVSARSRRDHRRSGPGCGKPDLREWQPGDQRHRRRTVDPDRRSPDRGERHRSERRGDREAAQRPARHLHRRGYSGRRAHPDRRRNGARNVVSANGASPPPGTVGSGIIAFSPITLQGNLVGTDATGTIGLATAGLGVAVSRTGPGAASLVGGITPELGNVLSGNSRGLELGNVTATVQGNRIGVGPDGTTPLPNGSVGIDVIGGTVTMGGTQPGAANIIANNRAQASV